MAWQEFLSAQGAQFDEHGAANFGGDAGLAATSVGAALVPLQHFGLIRFSGEETVPFLHGQLSSDVKQMPANGAQYSSYSTPKGRMLASFLLLRDGADLLLALPRALQAGLQKRLSMFVLRSKTKASDASTDKVLLGLTGPTALTLAEQVFGGIPATAMQTIEIAHGHLTRLPGDRLLLSLDADAASNSWQQLTGLGAIAASSSVWTLSDIRAGILWIQTETQEEFVAQMANMELIGAVSFKKGCYPGQEIVARTQYLGKLKRRTYRVSSTVPLQAGQPVFSPEMNGQASGQIAMAAAAGAGLWEALAVVQISSIEQGLHVESMDGPTLSLLPLPYAL